MSFELEGPGDQIENIPVNKQSAGNLNKENNNSDGFKGLKPGKARMLRKNLNQ